MPGRAHRWPQKPNRDTPRLEFPLSHRKQRPALIPKPDRTACFAWAFHRSPVTDHQPRAAALIGPPVIRIPRKPRGINNLNFSNRLKTAFFCSAAFQPAQLRTDESPRATGHDSRITSHESRVLIGPPVIRISPKPFRIRPKFTSDRLKKGSSRFERLSRYGKSYSGARIPGTEGG